MIYFNTAGRAPLASTFARDVGPHRDISVHLGLVNILHP